MKFYLKGLTWQQQAAFWVVVTPVGLFLFSVQQLANISWWLDKHIQKFNNKLH